MFNSEIRLRRAEHVHLAQGVILLPKAKAGARVVVLSSDAQKILKTGLEKLRRRYAAVIDATLRAAAVAVGRNELRQ